MFWETLSVNAVKCPKLYSKNRSDPFSRLRVPRYLKIFETIYFATFLALYYVVLVHRSFSRVTPAEFLLYIWITGFAYDELGGWSDAGQTSFYASDFWWMWDIVGNTDLLNNYILLTIGRALFWLDSHSVYSVSHTP